MTPEEKDISQQSTDTSYEEKQTPDEENYDSVANFLYFFGAIIIITMVVVGFLMLNICNDYSYQSYNPIYFLPPVECFASGFFMVLS